MNTSWFYETFNEDNRQNYQQNYPQFASFTVLSLSVFFIIVGTLGNTLAIIVFLNCQKLRRQPTTIFIMNLTIADLMISSISLPLMTMDFSTNDMTDNFFCKIAAVMYYGNMKSRQKLLSYSPSQTTATATATRSSKKDSQETEITYLMFKIFIGFLACFLPTVLVNIFDSEGKYPVYHLVESMTSCASVVINPIIYVSTNKLYRAAFREFFSQTFRAVSGTNQHHNNTSNRQPQISSVPPITSSTEINSSCGSLSLQGGG
ncbi:protein trapped in endoderm-1-like [Aphidius gifuensis]|uniref:protein trapped in endoderm-1-like n=1 Tax=Aphidius gifuensis TaxID=684658 RepID=UPI001CDD5756|nr:protein trapped in endoderm-1-like [Aphidius gifuensis]